MGVRGVKALLKTAGWYPSWEEDDERATDDVVAKSDFGDEEDPSEETSVPAVAPKPNSSTTSLCGCSTRLWKEWNASDAFMGKNNCPPLQKIPFHSKFLVDGNGLAFHLHSIAYSRYLRSLTNGSMNHGTTNGAALNGCCPQVKNFSRQESFVVQALPCLMPMSWLRTVTHEFVDDLLQQKMDIEIYWDGPLRRFKAKTDEKRQAYREQQESNLESYCRHGILPSAKRCRFACDWKDEFPFSRLFLLCVRHALQERGIKMVDCAEEADVELALKASGDSQAYVLGNDSDFLFFRDIQYIPLNEISIQSSGLYAFSATRSELARLLGLEEDQMIDLAMLMGNDYIDPLMDLELPDGLQGKRPPDIVFYLQYNEFEIKAKKDEYVESVDFVRALYNLDDLDKFTHDCDGSSDEEDEVHESKGSATTMTSEDRSVRDAVIRCLGAAKEQSTMRSNVDLVQAFERSTTLSSSHVPHQIDPNQARPSWEEMNCGFYIESCIRQLYKSASDSPLIKVTPPGSVLDRHKFQFILVSYRKSDDELGPSSEPNTNYSEANPEPISSEPVRLPIDHHESAILENIKNNRVTIIHGETGCGKSSRVPVMLLNAPPPDGSLRKVRFFISQPRRIAAKALVERVRQCEPSLRDKFALRMGHGWKEYESKDTQAYFVTTGYLVRLLANHPERFDDCTHLVIDEVHERSVDTDILCLLCRRLLENNKHIRLVLMSATLATKMYRDYFDVPSEPIHVGVRRYPIKEFFIEDIKKLGLPQKELIAAAAIEKEVENKKCRSPPTSAELSKRFPLAARLTTIVGKPGASVLIFVPGMAEIVSISEHIENFHVAGVRYTCFPIHSDIPFEEQMGAFDSPSEDEVKIIIATNAAESSVTLPSVDHVICLGLCRQIIYNQASHRQMLTPAWISQASATQRAGRTGRVRPGNVYRLYTRQAYESYMEEFEPGEMVRIPLDSVILMLKNLLHEEVKPVFNDCLEPPPVDTIDRSFQSLHRWNFISEPDDKADITSLGAFVCSLGVDLSLGSFIGLGIQFGVAAEAIEMAAMMSLPKTPFQTASPTWMTLKNFNETASKTYSAKCDMDCGLYSEPMALMNALWDYSTITNKSNWCIKNRIAIKRWQQVVSSRNSLRKRVALFLGINESRLQLTQPPKNMPRGKILILRILKVWVFSDSIIECSKSSLAIQPDGSVLTSVKSKSNQKLTRQLLNSVLSKDRHPYDIVENYEVNQTGAFDREAGFVLNSFLLEFEGRLLSYSSEKEIKVILCHSQELYYLFVDDACANNFDKMFDEITGKTDNGDRYLYKYSHKKRRGLQERAAGIWTLQDVPAPRGEFSEVKRFQRYHLAKKDYQDFDNIVSYTRHEMYFSGFSSVMIWDFHHQGHGGKKKKNATSQPFSVSLRGACKQLSNQDMTDLLGRRVTIIPANHKKETQSIVLRRQKEQTRTSKNAAAAHKLFVDVPEGARILAVLASSHRKGRNTLRFPRGYESDPELTIEFAMKQDEIDISKRWKRLDSDKLVYADESVPATAFHTTSDLFAVAANSLELQSGGLRVEGLTLLPPDPLFLVVAFLSFGLDMGPSAIWNTNTKPFEGQESRIAKKVSNSLMWLTGRSQKYNKNSGWGNNDTILGIRLNDQFEGVPIVWKKTEVAERLFQAANFHEESVEMGESLVCFPERIESLCNLLDSVDGMPCSRWETLEEESLTNANLAAWRTEPKMVNIPQVDFPMVESAEAVSPPSPVAEKSICSQNAGQANKESNMKTPTKKWEHHSIRQFEKEVYAMSKELFSTKLGVGESVPTFPSTNILAMLHQLYEELVLDDPPEVGGAVLRISLSTEFWDVARFRKNESGNCWYLARFVGKVIPYLPVAGRGKNKLPKWIKKQHDRPSTIEEAIECVPPNVQIPKMLTTPGGGIMFETIQDALQMESAFWLERQFCYATKVSTRHWYMYPMDKMIQVLKKIN